MTREEAKQAIATHCGLTIRRSREGKSYCGFSGFIFGLNLLGSEDRNGRKQAGFYFYSHANLQDECAVMSLWLQDKLTRAGFSPDECRVRTNRSSTKEGHAADIYIDFPWDDPTEAHFDRIRSICDRLRSFQQNVWPADEAVRNEEIRQYNIAHRSQVRDYVNQRRGERPAADEDYESDEAPPSQGGVMEGTIRRLLESNLNVILTGAPGTGKTFLAKTVAYEITGDDPNAAEQPHIASVQFHPGYDYSDFVVGMKPVLISEETGKEIFKDENGNPFTTDTGKKDGLRTLFVGKTEVSFRWTDGIFKTFADTARKAYDAAEDKENAPKFVFLIDEINRADLSRVFGELFSLLEEGYRYPNGENSDFVLLPNGERFSIPKNLYVIGTMNDIDRSVESMDFALRRRFAWKEVGPDDTADEILSALPQKETLRAKMDAVNALIRSDDFRLGPEYQLGGAIFAKFKGDYEELWNSHVANILAEYLRGRRDREERLEELKDAYDGESDDTAGGDERGGGGGAAAGPKVVFPDGTLVQGRDGADTLVKFMQRVGESRSLDQIARLDIRRAGKPLLRKREEVGEEEASRYQYKVVSDEYVVLTKSGSPEKQAQIRRISDELRLNVRPEGFESTN